ncbi:MAG: dephospho-CoA kinase [Gammaproteobacteria bacterium GWE2_37_16]|nr:MAG: dephospho-CoA kinase [Gammaproteobacteria bacterium GWE2_37_16]
MRSTLIIGLTGGIASGKSTVAKYFADLGVPIIDADVIAKSLTIPSTKAYRAILIHFGKEVCQNDGSLNRPQLRKIIFTKPTERLWLENLLHPLIYKEMRKEIKLCQAPYCILVMPLLVETKDHRFRKMINRALLVDTTKKKQMQRLRQRDHITIAKAKSILKAQCTRKERLALADDIIHNDKTPINLKKQISTLHKKYSTKH